MCQKAHMDLASTHAEGNPQQFYCNGNKEAHYLELSVMVWVMKWMARFMPSNDTGGVPAS